MCVCGCLVTGYSPQQHRMGQHTLRSLRSLVRSNGAVLRGVLSFNTGFHRGLWTSEGYGPQVHLRFSDIEILYSI